MDQAPPRMLVAMDRPRTPLGTCDVDLFYLISYTERDLEISISFQASYTDQGHLLRLSTSLEIFLFYQQSIEVHAANNVTPIVA